MSTTTQCTLLGLKHATHWIQPSQPACDTNVAYVAKASPSL